MPSLAIRWIHARAYCQATEDEACVANALNAAVSGGTSLREVLTGQFGNPVLVLERRLEKAEDLRATWHRWVDSGIPRALDPDLEGRLDDNAVLHFRVDKQAASEGMLSLRPEADAIDIQVKVKAYPAKPEEIRRVARALLSEAV